MYIFASRMDFSDESTPDHLLLHKCGNSSCPNHHKKNVMWKQVKGKKTSFFFFPLHSQDTTIWNHYCYILFWSKLNNEIPSTLNSMWQYINSQVLPMILLVLLFSPSFIGLSPGKQHKLMISQKRSTKLTPIKHNLLHDFLCLTQNPHNWYPCLGRITTPVTGKQK